jgi:hypothetical protein
MLHRTLGAIFTNLDNATGDRTKVNRAERGKRQAPGRARCTPGNASER